MRAARFLAGVALAVALVGCSVQASEQRKARTTLFVGVDASGSFKHSGYYDNALTFLAHYIYGHLHELGGLEKPQALFVASVGGQNVNEPKTFHPIHDFDGKDVAQIEADLRKWFPPSDKVTDFNPFFQEVARITKERNLVLAPITLMVVTDGVPDAASSNTKAGTRELFERINLKPLEYLARNVTVRLTYVSPKVGEQWRAYVPRKRVRLWTVDAEVMKGWKNQVQAEVDLTKQDKLWKWVQDNVDFRVRANKV
ncbi:MAG: hypothetical protein A3H49_04625 [Nitrospirae bacterium RIFCSPLOWO2_02_FULL_62_14]|nr:MAG: hypothetical protein A3H49_04625 [Nitrospirae bacterium RIFCSPLOWO2_02_FULL_62_14]OGW89715.1 MAG: hypothetical protein A3K11_14495 [Nitrospirae bacterium RIFCSPLOWO2_12_FULL_63_8]